MQAASLDSNYPSVRRTAAGSRGSSQAALSAAGRVFLVGCLSPVLLICAAPAHAQESLRTLHVGKSVGTSLTDQSELRMVVGQSIHGLSGNDGVVVESGPWHRAWRTAEEAIISAVEDHATTEEDASLAIPVLANDSVSRDGPLWITSVSSAEFGETLIQGDTVIVYTPQADYFGEDSFTYTVAIGTGQSASTRVFVTVNPVNDAPRFETEPPVSVQVGEEYRYEILATDVDGDALVLAVPTMPEWLQWESETNGTGILVGIPSSEHFGDHPVVISASDASAAVFQSFEIRVDLLAPEAPGLVAPGDGERDVSLPLTVSWAPVANSDSYWLQVARDLQFDDLEFDSVGIEAVSANLESLSYATLYFWRVRAVNAAGESPWSVTRFFETLAPVAAEQSTLPSRFSIGQNYPNPFNPQTRLEYALPHAANVRLEVFDGLGRRVAVLFDGARPAGRFHAEFYGDDLPAGVYVARIRAGEFVSTVKMMLLK